MNCEMVVQTVKGVVPIARFGATRRVDALVSEHPQDVQKSVALQLELTAKGNVKIQSFLGG